MNKELTQTLKGYFIFNKVIWITYIIISVYEQANSSLYQLAFLVANFSVVGALVFGAKGQYFSILVYAIFILACFFLSISIVSKEIIF
jgi:hypothetical protein